MPLQVWFSMSMFIHETPGLISRTLFLKTVFTHELWTPGGESGHEHCLKPSFVTCCICVTEHSMHLMHSHYCKRSIWF